MRDLVIVDIDGTLADIEHRLKYIKDGQSNWKAFYEACELDSPIYSIIKVINALSMHHKCIFITGRSNVVRSQTRRWLDFYLIEASSSSLLMRPEGDHRPDYIVKLELFERAGYKYEDILVVFEDRDAVVKAWRSKEVTVCQVADGNF